MSNTAPKPIPAHVVELDKRLTELTSHVERIQGGLNYMNALTDALVSMMGPDEVQKTIDERHVERLKPIAEAQKAHAMRAVADGKIVATEAVTAKSIVITIERNVRGSITNLRAQLAMALLPDLLTALDGKRVGDTVTIVNDTTKVEASYEIVEIYEPTDAGLEAPKPEAA